LLSIPGLLVRPGAGPASEFREAEAGRETQRTHDPAEMTGEKNSAPYSL
jgi:hypothetical protein